MKKESLVRVIIILIGLSFILPYMGVIYHTLPRNDEFACVYGIIVTGGYSLKTLVRFVAREYMTWEGNYSGVFIYSALNPILIGNSDSTVHFMNMICFWGFILGWSYILYRCLSFFDIEEKHKKVLALVFLIISMNCRFLRETLGWYTGYMYYMIQLLLGTLGLFMVYDLTVVENEKRSRKKEIIIMILACLFEVIGAGGTLHVSAILCFIVLLFFAWTIFRKKPWLKAAILFGSIFISTIINVAAPGHRVRKDGYESISLVQGGIYTLTCVYNEIKRLCTQTYLPYVLLIVLVVLFYVVRSGRKHIELNPILVGICGIACIVGSSFPVCYGYGEASMAARGYEMMDLMISIWAMLFLCSAVNRLKLRDIVLSPASTLVISIFAVFMVTTVAIDNVEISDIPVVQCAKGLADGSIKDYSDYWRNVLHVVETSDDKNLVIKVEGDYLDRECIIDRVMIQEDETNWVNTSMAAYYGHDTVRIERVD